jgi:hypothetical protein
VTTFTAPASRIANTDCIATTKPDRCHPTWQIKESHEIYPADAQQNGCLGRVRRLIEG